MFLAKVLNKGYQATNCEICEKQFNLLYSYLLSRRKFARIHKCKRCDRFICSNCGKHKQIIVTIQGKLTEKEHRICIICKSELLFMNQTIVMYQLKWASTSNFCISWLSKIDFDSQEYDHHLKLFYQNKEVYQEPYKIIQKDVMLGRTDFSVFNYSLRQFLYLVQKGKSIDSTRRSIANVLLALATKYPNIGYCQGMNGITAFLLCMGTENQAFLIFSDLIEHILPQNLYSRSSNGTNLIGLQAQNYFLKEYCLYYLLQIEKFEYDQDEIERIKIVIELMASRCMITLFVSNLEFTTLIFIWKRLNFQRSFIVIQKAFLAIIILFLQKTEIGSPKFRNYQKTIELMNTKQFQEKFETVFIDSVKKEELVKKFYEDFSKQWTAKDNYSLRRLSSFSKFKQDQLKMIQQQFIKFADKNQKQNQKKESITKKQYIEFVKRYDQQTKTQSAKFADELKTEFLENLFEVFDEEKNGLLDFREFICCISMNLRGTLREKLNFLIQTLKNENGYMNKDKFQSLVFTILSIVHKSLTMDQELQELQEKFKQRVNAFYYQQQKISITQLYVLVNDPFVNQATLRAVKIVQDDQAETIVRVFQKMFQLK